MDLYSSINDTIISENAHGWGYNSPTALKTLSFDHCMMKIRL